VTPTNSLLHESSEEPPPLEDWHWQINNSITTLEEIKEHISLSSEEEEAFSKASLPFRITPYYLNLVKKFPELRRCAIPTIYETVISPGEDIDPLNEDHQSPVPGIVHRYPDRVLFLATTFCSFSCRYCTRSRLVGHSVNNNWADMLQYIRDHNEIRDVLISGGDPLTMSDEKIDSLLSSLYAIPHIEIVRIGTKVPVVLPQRITPSLTNILKKYSPLYINIHFTIKEEITPECSQACISLANVGIPLGSQTVLLRGVNDTAQKLKDLFLGLLKIKVKPYYIYQGDLIIGSAHFRTSVERGIELLSELQGHITGFAVPKYIVDLPGGGGKVPVVKQYYKGQGVFENYKGSTYYA
jgi:lysine 2,3-aminomutase